MLQNISSCPRLKFCSSLTEHQLFPVRVNLIAGLSEVFCIASETRVEHSLLILEHWVCRGWSVVIQSPKACEKLLFLQYMRLCPLLEFKWYVTRAATIP